MRKNESWSYMDWIIVIALILLLDKVYSSDEKCKCNSQPTQVVEETAK